MFLILEGCGATLTIAEGVTKSSSATVADYLKTNMKKKVLTEVRLTPLDPNIYKFRTYKVRSEMYTVKSKIIFFNFFICKTR